MFLTAGWHSRMFREGTSAGSSGSRVKPRTLSTNGVIRDLLHALDVAACEIGLRGCRVAESPEHHQSRREAIHLLGSLAQWCNQDMESDEPWDLLERSQILRRHLNER